MAKQNVSQRGKHIMKYKIPQRLVDAAMDQSPVRGLTHGFYRYPARFSPVFVRTAIETFTEPGDLVMDPFVGGGATAVEALAMNRSVVVSDVNKLALFVTSAKTQKYTADDVSAVKDWVRCTASLPLNACLRLPKLQRASTWRIGAFFSAALAELDQLTNEQKMLARIVVLKTAQWALDCKQAIPSLRETRDQLRANAEEIGEQAIAYSDIIRVQQRAKLWTFASSASDLDTAIKSSGLALPSPQLILTSPPYPGVHILYHRWQLQGRQELSTPYDITGTPDGHGASYYTMGGRHQHGLEAYFKRIERAFSALRRIASPSTICVQVVGFAKPSTQLAKYVLAMKKAGWAEFGSEGNCAKQPRRVWRPVPGRRWYVAEGAGGGREVALFFYPI